MNNNYNRESEFDLNLKFDQISPIDSMVEETVANPINDEELSFQHGNKPNAHYLIKNAKILLASGDTKLAKRIFKALIENGELLGVAYSGLGASFELENKEDLAIKSYREAIIYEPSFGTLVALAELYIKKLDFQNAIGTLLRASTLSKLSSQQNFEVHKCLGNCYLHLAQLNNAESHYRRAYELNSQSDALHVNIGSLALKKQDSATAILHFKEAARFNAKNAQAYTGMGLAHLAQGNKQQAHDAFIQALNVDIREVSALYNLVKCAYELKVFDKASDVLANYIQSNAVNSHILFSYAGILYHQGKISRALEECQKLLQLSPEHDGAKRLREMIAAKQAV